MGILLFRKKISKLLNLKCQARGRNTKIGNKYTHIKDFCYIKREKKDSHYKNRSFKTLLDQKSECENAELFKS